MHPSNINSNGNNNFSTIDQHMIMTSFGYYYNHETPNFITSNMHSTLIENFSFNNNGNFLATDHDGNRFSNSHVILENNCLNSKKKSKSSNKDRHSKINTARGLKERRMRLSLDVAKKFFRLQDLLGFDKASNTIQWLLMKSQHAIQDLQPQQLNLMGSSNRQSFSSDCVIDDQSTYSSNKDQKKKSESGVRKITREKARERARKRTNEKRNIKLFGDGEGLSDQYSKLKANVDQNTNRLGLWIPFGEDQVQLTYQAEDSTSNFQFKQGINGENSSMVSSNWSPSLLFNNHLNLGPSHEHLGNFQNLGQPWEDINN